MKEQGQCNHRCFENYTSGYAVFPTSVASVRFGDETDQVQGQQRVWEYWLKTLGLRYSEVGGVHTRWG